MRGLSLTHYTALLISDTPLAAPLRRIAYPTSLSESSDGALHWAIQITKASDADLVLFHVLPAPVPLFEAEPFEKPGAEIALSLLVAQVNAMGVRATGSLLSGTDSVGKQIARAARLEKIDLIVMGTRDRSRIFRFFLGRSVPRAVVAQAECPVLIIPGNRLKTARPMIRGKISEEESHHYVSQDRSIRKT
jgi:nucleotide-binding universal stress UspA family protein